MCSLCIQAKRNFVPFSELSRPFKTPYKFYYSAINDVVNDRLGSQNGIPKILCSFGNNKDAVV